MLEIRNLTKRYGAGTLAVDDLSLTVEAGNIYGFIGHNGAGKTTTIRCVTGALDFDAGDILIDGHSVKAEPLYTKSVTAYVPDNPDLYEFLTGSQYIRFILDAYRVPADVRTERVNELANAFELAPDLGGPISGYSHGMKQKLALIAALAHKPKLMVLDEPFVGLDPKAAHTFKQIMRDMCAAGGAVFFSTHVLETAEKLCDRIAIIRGGRLVESGTIEQVKGNQSLEDVFLELIDNA